MDEESGQFYAEYTKDNTNYRLWLEDANSINLRTSLVHKYRLAVHVHGAFICVRGYMGCVEQKSQGNRKLSGMA